MAPADRPPRVLVTAGPTFEPLDPVRGFTNRSSGRMGFAVAADAAGRDWPVRLLVGATPLPPPDVDTVERFGDTRDLLAAVRRNLEWCDVLVMAAAPADYRPAEPSEGKIQKSDDLTVTLVRNPDVLGEIAGDKGDRVFVGFALESLPPAEATERARDKMRRKHLDLVVLNHPPSLGADRADFRLLWADEAGGADEALAGADKAAVAARILDAAAALLQHRS